MAETERQELDLNIENWSIRDLYDLFDIPKNATTNETARIADKIIERQTEGEIKYFLQLARNKIILAQQTKLEGDRFEEGTDRQLWDWYKNQYLTTGDATQANKATVRTNKVDIFDDKNGHYQMKQNRLGVNNTHNVPFLQGTMNPTLVNEIERTVIIDSQYRTNIYPYSGGVGKIKATVESAFGGESSRSVVGNPTSPSFNTNFTLSLSENLTNVMEIKLDSVSIPKTWDNFSNWIGNVKFAIRDLTTGTTYLIEIDSCSPATIQELMDRINGAINALSDTYNNLDNDFVFGYDEGEGRVYIGTKTQIVGNDGNIISPGGSGKDYEIVFFDRDLFANTDNTYGFVNQLSLQSCFNVMYTNNNFGWYLGWRITPNDENVVKFKYTANGLHNFADTSPTMKSIDYLVIVLDDFNKNRLNTGIVSGVQQSTKLPLPEYTNADNLNCNEQGGQPFFSKVAPRQLTQAQLYTINQIAEDRQRSKNRNTAPTLSDAFCIIPTPSNIEQNDRIVLFSNQLSTSTRRYFGPVNIERVKASLYDDKGNIVNLKGHDWSFTLKVKQLYQY